MNKLILAALLLSTPAQACGLLETCKPVVQPKKVVKHHPVKHQPVGLSRNGETLVIGKK